MIVKLDGNVVYTSPTNLNTGNTTIDTVWFGQIGNTAPTGWGSEYVDDLNFDANGWIGPTAATTPATATSSVSPPTGATTYTYTTFNEQPAGTALTGTTPAITTGGAAWIGNTSTFAYVGSQGVSSGTGTSNNVAAIATGAADETVRVQFNGIAGGNQLGLRFTDTNNFIAVVLDSQGNGTATVYNVVGGGTGSGPVCAIPAGGNGNGLVTAVLSGANLTLTYGGQTATCSVPGNTTQNLVAFNIYATAPIYVSGLSAASQ